MSNTWTNKTVALHLLVRDQSYLGFSVVSKDHKYFYPPKVDYNILLNSAKNVVVFNGYQINNTSFTKHNLQSLYYQLNSKTKFQSLEDIVKAECYSTDPNNIHYVIRPDGARACVNAASFMLDYYLKHYKHCNRSVLKLDNILLEKFSNRVSNILVDQVSIRTILSLLQKKKWDLEREVFNTVGYPVWSGSTRENELLIPLNKIKEYKEQIDYVSRFLGISKVRISFDTTATSTGRILCRDKIHNLGLFAPDNRFKDLFYCKDEKVFISADYKRQEAFILATVSNDSHLLEDVRDEDFYVKLAHKNLDKLDKQSGKNLFYAIIYGASPRGLADSLDITESEASIIISKVKKQYPDLTIWLRDFKENTNYFGRPLYKSTVNAYIQSTAADLIRQKLISTFEYNPVLVLSDNIIYRVPKKDHLKYFNQIKDELNTNPFNGLYTEPLISNTLKF